MQRSYGGEATAAGGEATAAGVVKKATTGTLVVAGSLLMASTCVFILQYMLLVTIRCLPQKSLATELARNYPFSAVLLSDPFKGYYTLHWNFSLHQKTINFAVNVSTTGWVGFGLSPTGGMVNSDLVIGWVDNGASYFKVSRLVPTNTINLTSAGIKLNSV